MDRLAKLLVWVDKVPNEFPNEHEKDRTQSKRSIKRLWFWYIFILRRYVRSIEAFFVFVDIMLSWLTAIGILAGILIFDAASTGTYDTCSSCHRPSVVSEAHHHHSPLLTTTIKLHETKQQRDTYTRNSLIISYRYRYHYHSSVQPSSTHH